MTDSHTLPPPRSVGAQLWDAVTAAYDLALDETETLYHAALIADLLDRMHGELQDAPTLTVRGSTGQPAVHPLVAAIAQQTRLLSALLAQLGLSDAEDAPVELPADVVRLLPRTARNG